MQRLEKDRVRLVGRVLSSLVCLGAMSVATACSSEGAMDPDPDEAEQDQTVSGGVARNVYYECTTATNSGGSKWVYKTSVFNNTSDQLHVEISRDGALVAGIYPTKATTNTFVDSSFGFRLQLANKRNGAKSIRVTHRERAAGEENGYCRVYDLNKAPPRPADKRDSCGPSTLGVLKDCLPLIVISVGVKACELCVGGAIPALSTGVGALPWAGACLACIGTVGVCGFRAKEAIDACF